MLKWDPVGLDSPNNPSLLFKLLVVALFASVLFHQKAKANRTAIGKTYRMEPGTSLLEQISHLKIKTKWCCK
jgi:hypothetical protein